MQRIFKNNYVYLVSAIFTGLILWMSWPPNKIPILLFVAFVPLLWLEETIATWKPRYAWSTIFIFHFLAFLIWNILSTGWIWNASPGGMVGAVLANAVLMSIPFLLFHITKKQLGNRLGSISLILYWLAFEYLHFNWELAWPWLTLGNGFAAVPNWVQWYEYTGALGGTTWILIMNILIFTGISRFFKVSDYYIKTNNWNKPKARLMAGIVAFSTPFLVLMIPLMISLLIHSKYEPKGTEQDVLIIQPNVDPYNEKFSRFSPDYQLRQLFDLSLRSMDNEVDFLVWPETSVTHEIYINNLNEDSIVGFLKNFISQYPNVKLITGFSPFYIFEEGEKLTATAREGYNAFYDAFNSALFIEKNGAVQYYHKSKLVPGVERMPYPKFFKFLDRFSINMGGISGSLGIQKERGVLGIDSNELVAPVICYESVFGEFVGDYIQNGAQCIFIITNDGWWGDTDGYKQHLNYASLRAIETRRSIARSANTGVSCFIDQKGKIHQATDYWVPAVIRSKILFNNEITFYTRHGDYFARIGVFVGLLFSLITISSALTSKFKFRRK